MVYDHSTRLESAESRREFLVRALGIAGVLLLPASVGEAALRTTRVKPVKAPSRHEDKAPSRHAHGSAETRERARSATSRRTDGAGDVRRNAKTGRRALDRRAQAHPRQTIERTRNGVRGRKSEQAAMSGAPMSDEKPTRLTHLREDRRSLSFYCPNTGERMQADYFVNGRYETDCLREIDYLLRDFRTGDVQRIDPRALDLLYAIRADLDTTQPLHVVCGYRSRLTNFLRRLTSSGVAEHSYHMQGQAIDFFVPGRQLRDVRMVAVSKRTGGVGYYPLSGFVHVDTGPVRYW